ncbi:methionine--tRNA ligase [endosymbiont of Sipalinus gigas]|uniref:methionine--tRNA ligase n=1 Tax=endosymbiont of Sipalinus gigas TaxID=1972134 RepID=UPI000DC6EA9B|nr:methionine--tRNA ligase [endosymbiont of Sipalinus gigas]BBA85196.1 methionine--tRNA ligase [endosymbiont of Sipalinus gigas]
MNLFNKKILVTCALPYSNGSLHLGHLLEQIQADIWIRYKKITNNSIYFICSDDSHGTPIMLKSIDLNIKPELLINNFNKEHIKNFKDFSIYHDYYYLTNNHENKRLINKFYFILKKNNLINYKYIYQFYDVYNNIFLPDRFILGKCPKCYSKDQFGDHCNKCNSVYNSINLINPKSTLSNSIPILKKTKHIFINLNNFKNKNNVLIKKLFCQKEIINKINEFIICDMESYNISRDYPYFGFKIPNEINKYFYVWVDALISYISTFKRFCHNINDIELFDKFWNLNSNYDIYQFIGKDIIFFHSIIWPYILDLLNLRKPTKIIVHGHLTINGYKMSKSTNNFITVDSYIKTFNSDYLRYYFASKLSLNINDIDFNIKDFYIKVNYILIDKIINIPYRIKNFLNNIFQNKLSDEIDTNLYNDFIFRSDYIWKLYEDFNFLEVVNIVIDLSNILNKYISNNEPWNCNNINKLHKICSTSINLFKIIVLYIKPIIPTISYDLEKFLGISLTKNSLKFILKYNKINFLNKNILKKINILDLNKLI